MKKILVLLLLALAFSPARAQFSVGNGGSHGPGGPAGSAPSSDSGDDADAQAKAKIAAPPPAIPGAQSPGDTVAPSSKVAAEMSPNDALFDAINRGDAGGARDALNRGAQLDARNVLGQTPIDVAVDLNRNDITFLLLSMRGPVGADAPPASSPPAHLVSTPVSATVPVAGNTHRGHKRAIMAVSPPEAGPTAATPSPSLADSGAPNPALGFTGFGR